MTMNDMFACMWNKMVMGTLICSLHFPAQVQRNHASPQLGYMMQQLTSKQVPFSDKSQTLQHKPLFSVQTVNLRDGYEFGSITVKFFKICGTTKYNEAINFTIHNYTTPILSVPVNIMNNTYK
jgi:hypothetical protein